MIDKFDLKDVTFLILVRLDSIERLENILTVTQFLVSNFNTTIEVLECSPYKNGLLEKLLVKEVTYSFLKDRDPVLFRTKFLNQMAQAVKTPYISIWDVDVIAPPNQLIDAVCMLRNNDADFVFPYKKEFLDISDILKKLYFQTNDIDVLLQNREVMKVMYPPNPVGGAFFCNLKLFFEVGMENEKFYGWGIEDGERCHRWEKSGYRIKRADGPLFHLTHPRGANSCQESQQDLFNMKRKAYHESARIKKDKEAACSTSTT